MDDADHVDSEEHALRYDARARAQARLDKENRRADRPALIADGLRAVLGLAAFAGAVYAVIAVGSYVEAHHPEIFGDIFEFVFVVVFVLFGLFILAIIAGG